MVVLHGGVAWWCCMVVLHGGVAWWCCMVVLHGGVAWWCCMVVLHGGVAWWCCHGGVVMMTPTTFERADSDTADVTTTHPFRGSPSSASRGDNENK